jgi:hypothetical protein
LSARSGGGYAKDRPNWPDVIGAENSVFRKVAPPDKLPIAVDKSPYD